MVVKRLKEYIDHKGLSIAYFEKSIGMSNASFGKSLKNNGSIGSDKLENILRIYTDINADWLLTGKGDMLITKCAEKNTSGSNPTESSPKYTTTSSYMQENEQKTIDNRPVAIHTDNPKEGIPLIPINAMAGALTSEQSVMKYECERYVVPLFKGAEFLIPVKGSSMYPKYSSGDIVACKRVPMTDLFFQWNKVYVLDTNQGALIKRIKKGSDDDHILIVSDNKDYEPFELPIRCINNVAIVIGVIRLE